MSVHVSEAVYSDARVGSPSEMLVAQVLAAHADGAGRNAYPSVGRIVEHTRMSERGVRKTLRVLEAKGVIVRDGLGPRGTFNYRLTRDPGAPHAGGHQVPGAHGAPAGGHHVPEPPAPRAPESVPEPSSNRPKPRARNVVSPIRPTAVASAHEDDPDLAAQRALRQRMEAAAAPLIGGTQS